MEEKYYADFTSKKNQVLLFARDRIVTAKDILEFYPDSPDPRIPASMILDRLSTKGMLKRTQVNIPIKGSMYYQYELTKTGEKKCIWVEDHIVEPDNETVFYNTRKDAEEKKSYDEKVFFLLEKGYYNRVPVEWKKQDWSERSSGKKG